MRPKTQVKFKTAWQKRFFGYHKSNNIKALTRKNFASALISEPAAVKGRHCICKRGAAEPYLSHSRGHLPIGVEPRSYCFVPGLMLSYFYFQKGIIKLMAEITMDKIIALCKSRGIIFSGSEIYAGLANTWDYGPLGVELKNNVKTAWWKKFVQ